MPRCGRRSPSGIGSRGSGSVGRAEAQHAVLRIRGVVGGTEHGEPAMHTALGPPALQNRVTVRSRKDEQSPCGIRAREGPYGSPKRSQLPGSPTPFGERAPAAPWANNGEIEARDPHPHEVVRLVRRGDSACLSSPSHSPSCVRWRIRMRWRCRPAGDGWHTQSSAQETCGLGRDSTKPVCRVPRQGFGSSSQTLKTERPYRSPSQDSRLGGRRGVRTEAASHSSSPSGTTAPYGFICGIRRPGNIVASRPHLCGREALRPTAHDGRPTASPCA